MNHQGPPPNMANMPWPNQHTPPPNFSVPPPTVRSGSFPRFSGPMNNQPTFQMNRNGHLPSINAAVPPPPFRGGGNQLRSPPPRFNRHPSRGGFPQRPQTSSQNQRPPGYTSDDIFGDAPPDIPCGFPYFNPNQPPPSLPNSINQQPPQQRGGHRGGGGGGRGNGFRGGQNSHPNRGRGDFHSGRNQRGMNRGGAQSFNGRGGMANGGQDFAQKKTQKVDKRDLPENNKFFCDICERGFKNDEKYQEHVSNHQKCSYKDCPFVAAPKLVQLHINMQHRGGLAKRVWNVATEEDIKKWKEERRKHYPTTENIKKKKEIIADRIARGEVIETKEFSKMSKGRQRGGRGGQRGRGRGGRGRRGGRFDYDACEDQDDPDAGVPAVVTVVPDSEEETSSAPIVVNDDDHDDDDGPPEEVKIQKKQTDDDQFLEEMVWEQDKNAPTDQTSKDSKNSLNLISGYGTDTVDSSSDDDEEDDEGSEEKLNATKTAASECTSNAENVDTNRTLLGTQKSSLHSSLIVVDSSSSCDNEATIASQSSSQPLTQEVLADVVNVEGGFNNNDSLKTTSLKVTSVSPQKEGTAGNQLPNDKETAANKKSVPGQASSEVKGVKRGHQGREGPPDKRRKFPQRLPQKSYTLLDKLLAKEIRRERNKVLQCVHFIVKNRFFSEASLVSSSDT